MQLTQKSKCQGCIALSSLGGEHNSYICKLGILINSEKVGDKNTKPVPADKCYKPKNRYQLQKAKEINAA